MTFPQGKITKLPAAAGILQFDVKEADWRVNLAKVQSSLAHLNPLPDAVIVLPELWATGFAYDCLAALTLETERLLAALQELAAAYHVLIAGSLPEQDGEAIYNSLFISGEGGVLGRYRKQQLFGPISEYMYFTPGRNPLPISSPLGILAGLVCYDLRFPELAASQAGKGAGCLVVAAQWPAARLDHWQTLLRARAIENQVFVVACNRCGATGGTGFAGHSMIIAPDGSVLFEADDQEAVGLVVLEPALLQDSRAGFNTAAPSPYRFADQDKICSWEELALKVETKKAVGKKIVFTNGCFDILHQGHVAYLEEARRQGDCLVVGVNSDSSIRAIKGPERPVNEEGGRARVLAALGCVDYVTIFREATPLNLINELLPDILVKGADWPVDKIVGAREVMANGGRVINVPMVAGFSTTNLIAAIRKADT